MSVICPCCRHRFEPRAEDTKFADLVEQKRKELENTCHTLGIRVSLDGFVYEKDAARLLGISPLTLRNQRLIDEPLAFRKISWRVEYALKSISEHLLKIRTDSY